MSPRFSVYYHVCAVDMGLNQLIYIYNHLNFLQLGIGQFMPTGDALTNEYLVLGAHGVDGIYFGEGYHDNCFAEKLFD